MKIPFLKTGLSINRSGSGSGSEKELSGVMTLATGASVSSAIRTETWNGKDYTVVPVVAIVEGVLHGANAVGPEFASADEFGKFPKAWDGRPVVMNHPKLNGIFVSAGIPEVLEEFGLGMIFNSKVEDRKLKVEAWLDHVRIEEVGGEMLTTLERIRKGDVVEVSVGAWLNVAQRSGVFNGKNYVGVWQNVAPDHLAFLSAGDTGACSVADGCGVPRLFSVNHAAIGASAEACCQNCAEGKACEGENCGEDKTGMSANEVAERLLATERNAEFFGLLSAEVAELLEFESWGGTALTVNKLPAGMDFSDARVLIFQALLEDLDIPSYDLMIAAMTTVGVVYHMWGQKGLFMRTYSINDDGVVKFSGEIQPVNLLTRIVPRQTTEPSVNITQENNMPGNAPGEGVQTSVTTNAGTGEAPAQSSSAPAANVNASVKAPTFEELLAAASPEVRESIEGGARMFSARKKELITQLVACERCAFSEAQLQSYNIEQLENFAKLADIQTFNGRAIPEDTPGINTNINGGQSKPRVAEAPTNYLAAQSN